jgi:hypothetical protein
MKPGCVAECINVRSELSSAGRLPARAHGQVAGFAGYKKKCDAVAENGYEGFVMRR